MKTSMSKDMAQQTKARWARGLALSVGLAAAPGLLASCAAMKTAYLEQNCNYDAAYEVGRRASMDLAAGRPTGNPAGLLQECPETTRDEALRGYRTGMSAGDHASVQINLPPPPPRGYGYGYGYGRGQAPRVQHFLCNVRAFTRTFEGAGETQQAAEARAKAACRTEYHEMHCDQAECREIN